MAESVPTRAQDRARSNCFEPASSNLDDLALQACDDADTLHDVMRAYSALKKLVDTSALNDSEVLTPSRTELSALLGLLNDALLVRIDIVNGATSAVREALRKNVGGAQ
ncbi:hypothetical protein SAMN05518854_1011026 [Variovorax sp. YR266]|uniref:hypothetical protein n=1 Tax=Variovorax sp. YR266 TaxID=1884386 RepID=UPI00089B0B87|nr:hypothetical protein [Variovorax sp. YR266]SDY41235.1 hypothetical protein SAMN05518854_1011026 [Variovorax sp. YR266]